MQVLLLLRRKCFGFRCHVRRVHEDQNVFKCPSCVKAFKQNKYLQYHIETVHKGVKPFLCHMCEKSYGNVSNLNQHIKYSHEKLTREEELSATCEKCHKIFNHKYALAHHVKNIHQKIPCSFCGKIFPESHFLIKKDSGLWSVTSCFNDTTYVCLAS